MCLAVWMWRRAKSGGQQFVDYVLDAPLGHRFGNAAAKVRFKHLTTHPFQRALHRRQLMEHVDAITIVVDHADHAVEMPAGGTETKSDR